MLQASRGGGAQGRVRALGEVDGWRCMAEIPGGGLAVATDLRTVGQQEERAPQPPDSCLSNRARAEPHGKMGGQGRNRLGA